MKIFKNVIKSNSKLIIWFVLSGVSISLLSALGVNYFRLVLDDFGAGRLSLPTIMLYGVIMVAYCVISYCDNLPYSKLENGIYFDFKLMALKKMSTIGYLAYQKIGTGKLIQQIENGASAGKNIVFGFYLRLFRELLPNVLFSLIFIALMDIKLVVLVLAGYLVVFVITNVVLKYLYKIKSHILVNEELLNRHLVRGFMEMVVFRTNRRFASEIEKSQRAAGEIVGAKTKMLMIHELFFTVFELLVIILKIAVLVYATLTHSVTVGATVALITFLDKAYQPIAIFNVLYVQFKLDKLALGRYADMLNLPDDLRLSGGKPVSITKGAISFESISQAYEGKAVIEKLSFDIVAGSAVALVGESGSGKSTIAKQHMGLVKPCSGEIFIDSALLSEMSLDQYYGHISYTSQDSPIFEGTLRENVIFDQKVPDGQIIDVLKAVQLGELYGGLKNGLDTQVGEKGVLLSGGERQRLAIARIFLSTAKIVILDEATSAMDNITEEAVMASVMERLRGRTLIFVAHRLSSIRGVDNIFALKNGTIIEQGSFEDLSTQNGYFKQLWEISKRDFT